MRSLVGATLGLPLVALVCAPIERRFGRFRSSLLRRGWQTDALYFVTRPLLQLAGLAAALVIALPAVLSLLPALLLRPLVLAQPLWLRAVEAFVLFDFLAYWLHRLAHEVPFLWRFHSIHHSSRTVDWLATARDHPLDHAIVGVPVLFVYLAGFPLLAAAASFALVRGAGAVWAHLNVRWRLRPIQKVFITPAVHAWHHATDPDAINTNYAAALPVWDVLFGTFFSPRDRVPSGYGCTEPVPDGFAAQLAYPLRRMRTSRDITDSSLHTS